VTNQNTFATRFREGAKNSVGGRLLVLMTAIAVLTLMWVTAIAAMSSIFENELDAELLEKLANLRRVDVLVKTAIDGLGHVLHETELIDRAEVTRGERETNEATEFGHPQAAALDIDTLPTLGLDVGVRNVLGANFVFSGNETASHSFSFLAFRRGADLRL